MMKFSANKNQLKRLLLMLILSIIVLVIGILFLIYEATHYCDDIIKYAGWLFVIGGLFYLVSTVLNYMNTTIEVIANEDYVCINKAGINEIKSKIINYTDINSISCIEKEIPFFHNTITSISIITKTGTVIINNIENAGKCVNLIKDKINTNDK